MCCCFGVWWYVIRYVLFSAGGIYIVVVTYEDRMFREDLSWSRSSRPMGNPWIIRFILRPLSCHTRTWATLHSPWDGCSPVSAGYQYRYSNQLAIHQGTISVKILRSWYVLLPGYTPIACHKSRTISSRWILPTPLQDRRNPSKIGSNSSGKLLRSLCTRTWPIELHPSSTIQFSTPIMNPSIASMHVCIPIKCFSQCLPILLHRTVITKSLNLLRNRPSKNLWISFAFSCLSYDNLTYHGWYHSHSLSS